MNPYTENENRVHSMVDLFGQTRLLERYKANSDKKSTSERAELFRLFLNELNPERIKKGLKPMKAERLGYIFEGCPTADLYALDKACRGAKSYGAMFWYRVKPISPVSTPTP